MGLVEYNPPNNNDASSQWSECNLLTPKAGPRKIAVLESSGDKYFIICWSCYQNIILPTPLAAFFSTEELPKSRTASCKFAEFWVRFAWHHVLSGKGDIDTLLLGAGQIAASEQRCPNASLKSDLDTKSPSDRIWYTIADPDSGDLLKQWTICGDCRSQIVKVYPPFEHTLKMVSTAPVRAMCDLVPKIAAVRSMICFKELINCEQAAHETDELDMRPLADFIKRFTNVPACPKDIPTYIPRKFYHIPGGSEYAICQDCYLTFIEPEARAGGILAKEVLLSPKPMPEMTCQLYSERMRRVWADAAATSDKAFLLQKMSERSAKERNRRLQTPRLKQRGAELLHQYNMLNAKSRHENMMAFNAMQANSWNITNTRILNTITYGTSFQQVPAWKPMDTSQSDNTLNQANAALEESNRVFAELSNLEKEWKMFWE